MNKGRSKKRKRGMIPYTIPGEDKLTDTFDRKGKPIYVGHTVGLHTQKGEKYFKVVRVGGHICLRSEHGCTYLISEFNMSKFWIEPDRVANFLMS